MFVLLMGKAQNWLKTSLHHVANLCTALPPPPMRYTPKVQPKSLEVLLLYFTVPGSPRTEAGSRFHRKNISDCHSLLQGNLALLQ